MHASVGVIIRRVIDRLTIQDLANCHLIRVDTLSEMPVVVDSLTDKTVVMRCHEVESLAILVHGGYIAR